MTIREQKQDAERRAIFERLDTLERDLDVLERVVFERADPRKPGYPGGITKSGDTDRLSLVTRLVSMIKQRFDYQELTDLARDIGVDLETLENGSLSRKINALVTYCQRRGKVGLLVNRCRELRPNEPGWPVVDQSDEVDWK